MNIKWLFFLLILANICFAQKIDFGLEPAWLESEQKLSATTPFFSNVRNFAKLKDIKASNNGDLPAQYLPENAPVFSPIVILLKEKDVKILGRREELIEKGLLLETTSGNYVKFFIHPASKNYYQELLKHSEAQFYNYLSTPSSSSRSLFTMDKLVGKPFIVKTSIDLAMGGLDSRVLTEPMLIRSTIASQLYSKVHEQTKGLLSESKMSWNFLPENVSVVPRLSGLKLGGYTVRDIPLSLQKDKILLPVYSLIASKKGNKWIDDLYQASGFSNKVDFLYEKYTKPMVELFWLISSNTSYSTMFHQQNLLASVDKSTHEIDGFVVRDMEAHFSNYPLMNELGLEQLFEKQPWSNYESEKLYRYILRPGFGHSHFLRSYLESIRFHSIRNIVRYFLDTKEVDLLLKKTDEYFVKKYNDVMPKDFQIKHISEFEPVFNNFAQKHYALEKTPEWLRNEIQKYEKRVLEGKGPYFVLSYFKWLSYSVRYSELPSEKMGLCNYVFMSKFKELD